MLSLGDSSTHRLLLSSPLNPSQCGSRSLLSTTREPVPGSHGSSLEREAPHPLPRHRVQRASCFPFQTRSDALRPCRQTRLVRGREIKLIPPARTRPSLPSSNHLCAAGVRRSSGFFQSRYIATMKAFVAAALLAVSAVVADSTAADATTADAPTVSADAVRTCKVLPRRFLLALNRPVESAQQHRWRPLDSHRPPELSLPRPQVQWCRLRYAQERMADAWNPVSDSLPLVKYLDDPKLRREVILFPGCSDLACLCLAASHGLPEWGERMLGATIFDRGSCRSATR